MESQKKKKIAFPETALLLLIIVVFIAALTYFVPAGEFDRIIDDATGREIVVAGSYHEIDRTPTTPLQLFSSIFRGIVKASDIIAMVFVIGGAFGIVSICLSHKDPAYFGDNTIYQRRDGSALFCI